MTRAEKIHELELIFSEYTTSADKSRGARAGKAAAVGQAIGRVDKCALI